MNGFRNLKTRWRRALASGALCAAIGGGLLWLGGWPVLLSYDLLFLLPKPAPPEEVALIYMDERSYIELGQEGLERWDRSLHAQLLDRLTEDESRLVVFDVVFSEPGTPEEDARLSEAIGRNGRVVLAAAEDFQLRRQLRLKTPTPLLPAIEPVVAGWGLAAVELGPGQVVRQFYNGVGRGPSLPYAAAALMVGEQAVHDRDTTNMWLNYYGPPLTLNYVSYVEALEQPAGYFTGKTVFIGARPEALGGQDEVDTFRTPYTLLGLDKRTPGVEIIATAYLNLIRNDEFTRLSGTRSWLLVLLTGLLLGGALGLVRPRAGVGIATVALIASCLAAVQAAQQHVWFPWTVMAFAQLPVALAVSLRAHYQQLQFDKAVVERTLEQTTVLAAAATRAKETGLVIPDHTLVRCVGKGAYGEVWLATNTIGTFHAVKIVKRSSFPADAPYEREFKGIKMFMPISRSHPGWVDVLHVGRNDDVGYFFYIMEVADDQSTGAPIQAEGYTPKSLATELHWRGKLPPEECLQLGLTLSDALEHLHQHDLVHRDIKPGNIIYVRGAPRIADVGLVTEQQETPGGVSFVGTEGYVPPEGPGSPAADVYALGKVLYEACMGRDRQLFPEVPTALWEEADDSLLRRLNDIIGRACATKPSERYPTAAALHQALMQLR